jgi:hypothetical protein
MCPFGQTLCAAFMLLRRSLLLADVRGKVVVGSIRLSTPAVQSLTLIL